MSWTDLAALKPLLLPPGVLFALALVGWLRGGRAGRRLAAGAAILLAVLSLPITAKLLMLWVEGEGAQSDMRSGAAAESPPQAIIVLAGDYRSFAPEYGEATVGPLTLMRLRHGAYLHRKTGLPIAVSGGGTPPEHRPSLGPAMRIVLERDFAIPVRWVEDGSRNTFENARDVSRLLSADGIGSAFLVTHAFHMRRATFAFAAVGFPVRPAPVGGLSRASEIGVADFLPTAAALALSTFAAHEAAGLAWYRVVAAVAPMTRR